MKKIIATSVLIMFVLAGLAVIYVSWVVRVGYVNAALVLLATLGLVALVMWATHTLSEK
jgi:hypothetical protein